MSSEKGPDEHWSIGEADGEDKTRNWLRYRVIAITLNPMIAVFCMHAAFTNVYLAGTTISESLAGYMLLAHLVLLML